MISYSACLDEFGGELVRAQRLQVAVLAHPRRIAGDEVQVGAFLLQHLAQECVDVGHGVESGSGGR